MADEVPAPKKKAVAKAKAKKVPANHKAKDYHEDDTQNVLKRGEFEVLDNLYFKDIADAFAAVPSQYERLLKNYRFIVHAFNHYLSNLNEEYKHKVARGDFDDVE